MPPPSRFVFEVSRLRQAQPPVAMLARLNRGFLPPWRDLLFQLSTVALPARCCCCLLLRTLKWHSLTWANVQVFPIWAASENTDSCATLAIYILPPVWLYSGDNFHFASRKFQEKLGTADNSQTCVRVCLKHGGLYVGMVWGQREVWGGNSSWFW